MEEDEKKNIKLHLPRKDLRKILDFFSLYFQKVFLYIKKRELVFFNTENETKITLIIHMPYADGETLILPKTPYMMNIKKTLSQISVSDDPYIYMEFNENGYGFNENTEEYSYEYFKKNNLDQIMDFKKDKKAISKFKLTEIFNVFAIHSKNEEHINFKIDNSSILFFYKNDTEINKLKFPLHFDINLINDVGKNSYFVNILLLRIISKITKSSKNINPIICSIMCDENKHYISSLKITFDTDNFKIIAQCGVTCDQ